MSPLSSEQSNYLTTQFKNLTTLEQGATKAEAKLKRLTAAYLEEAISLTEYRELKNQKIEEKQELKEKISRVRSEKSNRLEPLTRFVKSLQQATLLTQSENPTEKVKFLKTTGSNLTIADRKLKIEFTEPWNIIENHGRFAQHETSAPDSGALVVGEKSTIFSSAERGRFELP